MLSLLEKHNKVKYFLFHKDHGHDTEQCKELKKAIENAFKKTELKEFIENASTERVPSSDFAKKSSMSSKMLDFPASRKRGQPSLNQLQDKVSACDLSMEKSDFPLRISE
ncbi:hypothetical protein M9H77_18113 [Catharanthus roseus]|uniref:Uncharacterized protein n=1 Tax=Catharanthus roseus TaxID=4058 RepID=A0ACC0B6J3_CATRO|nr:hypothetical protein M9H77_18113 [Catharanthus roseus]